MAGPSSPRPWVPPGDAGREGLVGVGGDLAPATLRAAYREGVFPWFSDNDPILWWSPDPRGVFELDAVHVSRSLARTLKSGKFRVSRDQAFAAVMRGCTERREDGTWITPAMLAAYEALHRLGDAHSVEVWRRDVGQGGPELVGGIYGVRVGSAFCGESMFHRATDASKVALVALADHLREQGFTLFDVQMVTEHTGRMGAVTIPRAEYLSRLAAAVPNAGVRFEPLALEGV